MLVEGKKMTKKNEEMLILVIKAIDIIEKGIKKRKDKTEIKKQIDEEIYYNYKYFCENFKNILGCSINDYISHTYLLTIYQEWEKDKKELAQRDSYSRFKYFPFYFKRKFGSTINEVDNMCISKFTPQISKEELMELKDFLDTSAMVKSYEMQNGDVRIKFDNDVLLQMILRCKSYMIPEKIIKETNWKDLPDDTQKLLLIILDRMRDGMNQIEIPIDELELEDNMLEMYNIKEPVLMNGYYIFSCKLEEVFKPAFTHLIGSSMVNLTFKFPNGSETPQKYLEVIKCIDSWNSSILTELDDKRNKIKEKVIDILWKMAQKGFVKIWK